MRLPVLLATVGALLVVTALPAAAHNEFKSSNPAPGATVDTVPEAVVLTFSEELIQGKTTVTVTGPDGANAAAGEAKLDGPVVSVPIAAARAGAYTVAYKVIADDGDVTDSKFTFTLALAAVTTTTTTTTTTTQPTTSQVQNTAGNSDSGTTWWPWVVAALAVVVIAVVLLIVRRRRGTTSV